MQNYDLFPNNIHNCTYYTYINKYKSVLIGTIIKLAHKFITF